MKFPITVLAAASFVFGLCISPAPAADTPGGKDLPHSARPVVIAREGEALLDIVVAPGAAEETKKTAARLAGQLETITGGEFEVVTSREPKGITLGTLEQFPDPGLEKPLPPVRSRAQRLRAAHLGHEHGRLPSR